MGGTETLRARREKLLGRNMSLFYEDLVKSGRIGASGLLPPAQPICLYKGEEPWRSPLALEELV